MEANGNDSLFTVSLVMMTEHEVLDQQMSYGVTSHCTTDNPYP